MSAIKKDMTDDKESKPLLTFRDCSVPNRAMGMKLWGSWFATFDEPTDFKARTDNDLQLSIKCMKVSH